MPGTAQEGRGMPRITLWKRPGRPDGACRTRRPEESSANGSSANWAFANKGFAVAWD